MTVESLTHYPDADQLKLTLSGTDNDMVRVIDDLVDLLISKQLLMFTELPQPVQSKLLTRKQLREHFSVLQNLINEDDKLI